MKREDVEDVITCLGNERKVYPYFKDRYCLDAIQNEMDRLHTDRLPIRDLKQGRLAYLANKPVVVELLKKCGNGILHRDALYLNWPQAVTYFRLSLDVWGYGDREWDQTTRGLSNLVLQINFDGSHVEQYKKLIKPIQGWTPFQSWGHPISGTLKTMAWVRMDIDFNHNEVLIEEIQNDWIRKAGWLLDKIERINQRTNGKMPRSIARQIDGSYEDVKTYVHECLQPYKKLWSEVSLAAAISFIKDDLGVNNIYYHTFETGAKMKRMDSDRLPPKSLYTKLPRQFGFIETPVPPKLVTTNKYAYRCLRAIGATKWYRLTV